MGERRRSRRRRRRRWERRLRTVGPVVGVAVLFAAVSGWLLYRDAMAARAALVEAQSAVRAVQAALGEADLATAEAEVRRARAATGEAASRTSGPLWSVGLQVPVAGRIVHNVKGVVDVARVAVRTVDAAVSSSAGVLTPDGQVKLERSADGRLDLAGLRQAAAFLDDLPVEELEAARNDLADAPATYIPAVVAEGRKDSLDLADDAIATLRNARLAMASLPSFLGADEPRRYFLAMQNPAELRGTGGLIGFFAILTADDGRFEITEPEVYNVLNVDEHGDLSPVPTSEEFRERYEHVSAAGFFANANSDPDLPTSAEVMLDLYEDRRGERLDGVVAMDPVGLGYILEGVGSVPVPAEVSHPRLPNPVPPDRIPSVTMIDAYEVFGGANPERKDFLGLFAGAVFEHVFSSAWDTVTVGQQAGKASGRRHLQLYSRDAAEQAAFERLGIAGAMQPREAGADLLAVAGSNAAGNKQDVHVAHRLTARIDLGEVGEVDGEPAAKKDATVRVELENPLPTSGRDIYIIGAHPLSLLTEGKEPWSSPRGLNRTWFTVWSPVTTLFERGRGPDGEPAFMMQGEIHGHRAVDHFLETPSESTNGFEVDLGGPVQLRRDGDELVYELTLWRQAKAIPDHWDLTIAPPDGYQLVGATVEGGGDGKGMGVGGDGTPLRASIEGEAARVVGAATQDAHIEVRFTQPRSLTERMWAWLNEPVF